MGKEDVDTDEFDTHVIVHEWGHSFGGFHRDPIAKEEVTASGMSSIHDWPSQKGFCNALSAIILEPDTVYSDSSGVQQKNGFWEDIDDNDTSAAAKPGWYSETTVQNIVFDLYDDDKNGAEAFDKVSPRSARYLCGNGGWIQNDASHDDVISFRRGPEGQSCKCRRCNRCTRGTPREWFGIWNQSHRRRLGTNETHGGDDPNAIPVYIGMKIGDSKTVTLVGGLDWALLGQNRFLRFTGNGSPVNVSTSSLTTWTLMFIGAARKSRAR
ncbi:MAG: hypothetical protein IPM54_34450 [Polyangiaceae bacterium]|nr:hypothetical protein [Polyangiaceae bacterium]